MLRLVSFGLDWHWAIQASSSSSSTSTSTSNDQSSPEGAELNPRSRCSNSRSLDQYSFLNCLIYVLYPPLFIAGPIMTFNDFTSQVSEKRQRYQVHFLHSVVSRQGLLTDLDSFSGSSFESSSIDLYLSQKLQ